MKKTALYFRISTAEQTLDPQRLELRQICVARGWAGIEEYSDIISGAKFTRTGLDRLMADVRKGRIARLLCVKLDRLGRSLSHLAQLIDEFESHQVALLIPGQGIDTSRGDSAGKLQMGILSAVAEFERSLIRERTKAGLVAARSRGVKLGRPKLQLTAAHQALIDSFRRGQSGGVRELAARLRISTGSVTALLRARTALPTVPAEAAVR